MVRRSDAGFTLIDMLLTVAVIGLLAGMAVPSISDVVSRMRLGQGLREVERELQTARLRAVTSNRPIRVRFNCPAAGQYRMVELIGSTSIPDAADTSAGRCSNVTYPYPATDNNPLTRPNNDGPVRILPKDVTFGAAATIEFWPDGSAHLQNGATNPWPVVSATGTAITLTKGTEVRRITVNGLGKIQLVQ